MLGPLRRWWKRRLPTPGDRAAELIWRSQGILGEFHMDVCTNLLKFYPNLTQEEYEKVLTRYWEHVSSWHIAYDIIGREIAQFAKAAGRDPKEAFKNWWDRAGRQIMEEFA